MKPTNVTLKGNLTSGALWLASLDESCLRQSCLGFINCDFRKASEEVRPWPHRARPSPVDPDVAPNLELELDMGLSPIVWRPHHPYGIP